MPNVPSIERQVLELRTNQIATYLQQYNPQVALAAIDSMLEMNNSCEEAANDIARAVRERIEELVPKDAKPIRRPVVTPNQPREANLPFLKLASDIAALNKKTPKDNQSKNLELWKQHIIRFLKENREPLMYYLQNVKVELNTLLNSLASLCMLEDEISVEQALKALYGFLTSDLPAISNLARTYLESTCGPSMVIGEICEYDNLLNTEMTIHSLAFEIRGMAQNIVDWRCNIKPPNQSYQDPTRRLETVEPPEPTA